ncbi:MAG TPA: glycosyltransferase family 4 protein [Opitutaceae bacterium]|jgi:glycosyltransferase involved in cell wall biosynthesis|nr:glycosyltransferase family 4 protein [Opitutaceae bacterium]
MPAKAKKTRIVFYANCLGRGGAHQTQLAWFDLLKPVEDFELKIFCAAEGWFAEQLRRRGLDYEILPMPRALGLIKHGSWQNKRRTFTRILSMAEGLLRAWRRVALLKADIVVLTGGRDFIMLFPLAVRRRKHTVTVPQTTDWGLIPTCKFMCRMAAKTYAISDTVAESITAMGIAPQKVSVHPLIYTADYNGRLPAKGEIRRQLGLPLDAPILGMTGVIRPQKGQREAILVLEEVIKRLPDARLVIVGAPPADGPDAQAYHGEIRALVDARGLHDRVIFLGWRDDVPQVMHAMDVLLVPSHNNEGVPRVILEGLEAGLPVLATDIPQFREIIGKHEAGFLHPIEQISSWADDVVQLVKFPQRLAAASKHARSVWESLYSCESVRPRIETAFRDLAPANGGRV